MVKQQLIDLQKQYNTQIEVKQVEIHELISSQAYQRKDLNKKNINRIVNEFDPFKLGVLTVSCRRGKYFVIDGQHRLTALLLLYGDTDFFVRCEVQYKHTYQSEAHRFVNQDVGKTAISPYQRFNAQIEEQDEETVAINRIVNSVGLKVALTNYDRGDGVVRCIDQMRRIYRKHGSDFLREVLWLTNRTWGGKSVSLKTQVVGGVALFCKTYSGEYSDKTFIKGLSSIASADKIISEGMDDRSANGDIRYAKVIWYKYNESTRKSKLPYKFNG